jgi:hypothetical protein
MRLGISEALLTMASGLIIALASPTQPLESDDRGGKDEVDNRSFLLYDK